MDTLTLKALTIRQPWAWAIFAAGKDIENRTWATQHRGLLLIHAGAHIDRNGYGWLLDRGIQAPDPATISRRCLLGTIEVLSMVAVHSSLWFEGPVGWVLGSPRLLNKPIPRPGAQGLFSAQIPRSHPDSAVIMEQMRQFPGAVPDRLF